MVHRSGALLGYGGARYREVFIFRGALLGLLPAALATAAVAFANGLFYLPPTRAALRRVMPASGEGPMRSIREGGSFEVSGASELGAPRPC
jgi:hypothetical protein